MNGRAQHRRAHLDDSAYIRWAETDDWSLTQAVFLLHGHAPPRSKLSKENLIKKFPDAKKMIGNLPVSSGDNTRETPEDWAVLAMHDGMKITDSWRVIYSIWIPDDFRHIFGEIPDYRRFITVLVRDIATPLGSLAELVLNLGEASIHELPAKFENLLEDMNTLLDLGVNETGALSDQLVSPREFIEKCPPQYLTPASPCLHWLHWMNDHPTLSAWLNDSTNPQQQVKTTITKKRTRRDPLTVLVHRYLDRCDGEGDLDGLVNFVLQDPSMDEGTNGEIKYQTFSGINKTVPRKDLSGRLSRARQSKNS